MIYSIVQNSMLIHFYYYISLKNIYKQIVILNLKYFKMILNGILNKKDSSQILKSLNSITLQSI